VVNPSHAIPGVSLGDESRIPWLGLTTFLGLVFLGGQLFLWSRLAAHGFHMDSGANSSFVYFLTGLHALHVSGGMLVLLFADVTSILRRPVESRRIMVDVTAWYWHVMTGLWLCIVVMLGVVVSR